MITLKKLQMVNEMITQLAVLNYAYFEKHYKPIARDLSKQ